MFVQSSISY